MGIQSMIVPTNYRINYASETERTIRAANGASTVPTTLTATVPLAMILHTQAGLLRTLHRQQSTSAMRKLAAIPKV